MKRLNGFSEVLRGFKRFLITSEKLSVYLSEVYNPTRPTPPHAGGAGMGWGGGWSIFVRGSAYIYYIC